MSTLKIRTVPANTGTVTIAHIGAVYELFKIAAMMTSKAHVDPVTSLLNSIAAQAASQWERGAVDVFVVILTDLVLDDAKLVDYIKVTYRERKDDVILDDAVRAARDSDPDGDEIFAELNYALFAVWPNKVRTTNDGEHWVQPRALPAA